MNPLERIGDRIRIIDQRFLPHQTIIEEIETSEQMIEAIRDMKVRGAPLIGFCGLYALALAAKELEDNLELDKRAGEIIAARPTAINLEFEVNRAMGEIKKLKIKEKIFQFVMAMADRERQKLNLDNLRAAEFAIEKLKSLVSKKKFNILTICNTGELACGARGTALGVVTRLHELEMLGVCYLSETRPYLQGARLSAFELAQKNIDHFLIVEGAYSHLLKSGQVDAIFIGADRIAANGDTANKVGSATLAIVAQFYKVPFFVIAPSSSFDFSISSGDQIPIEFRPEDEVLSFRGQRLAPSTSRAFNPSFDVTPNYLISGIACENGLASPVTLSTLGEIRG